MSAEKKTNDTKSETDDILRTDCGEVIKIGTFANLPDSRQTVPDSIAGCEIWFSPNVSQFFVFRPWEKRVIALFMPTDYIIFERCQVIDFISPRTKAYAHQIGMASGILKARTRKTAKTKRTGNGSRK